MKSYQIVIDEVYLKYFILLIPRFSAEVLLAA
jgi:hypothetical protein